MSKFTIKVELQGLKIEVEGSRDDVPKLAARVGEQFGNLVKPALLLEATSAKPIPETNGDDGGRARGRGGRRRGSGGAGGTRAPADDIAVSIDPATHGSPRQEWKTAQKAIWFLYVVLEQIGDGLTASRIAKGFNKHFKVAGAINVGNVSRDLEKERLKGTGATVGADTNEGAARYFLTAAGIKAAEGLIRGEAMAATK